MASALLRIGGRFAKAAIRKAAKSSVKAKKQAVRNKAKKASSTKVQTAPASRKIGTKATLNGKTVYWGGKDFGWQSKASLTKIRAGKAKKPAKPNSGTKAKLPVREIPTKKSQLKAKSTKTAPTKLSTKAKPDNSSTRKAKPSERAEYNRQRAEANRLRSKESGKSTAAKRGRVEVEKDGERRIQPGTKEGNKTRQTVSKTTQLPKSERIRQAKSNLRDRGAKYVDKKTPKDSSTTASQARGPAKDASSKGSEPIDRRRKARSQQQKQIDQRVIKERGPEARTKGRVQRLSAADARAAADQYEIDRMKEITKKARTMTGRTASDYMKKAKKEMKREAASIRANARTKSLTIRNASKNNEAPRSSYQDTNKLSLSRSNRRSLADEQRRGERLSQDMENRKAAGKLKPIKQSTSTKAGPGKKASTSSDVKRNTTRITGREKAKTIINKDGVKESKSAPKPRGKAKSQRQDNKRELQGIDPATSNKASATARQNPSGKQQGPKRASVNAVKEDAKRATQTVKGTNSKPAAKPAAQRKAQAAKEQKANETLRRRNERRSSNRRGGRTPERKQELRMRSNSLSGRDPSQPRPSSPGESKSGRSPSAEAQAQQTMKAVRARKSIQNEVTKHLKSLGWN